MSNLAPLSSHSTYTPAISTRRVEPLEDRTRAACTPDWNDVVRDVAHGKVRSEKFWVSCYKHGHPSLHSGLLVTPSSATPRTANLTPESGLEATWVDMNSFQVTCPSLNAPNVLVRAPRSTYPRTLTTGPINCMDVSPQGQLLLAGGADGVLRVLDAREGKLRVELNGHVGDITVCRFFPSGQVVLSGSSDLQLRIWSALDGTCVRILKGHAGGILDVAIVDRGRNVLSSSRDGTVRLWECASGTTLRTVVELSAPINRIALAQMPGFDVNGADMDATGGCLSLSWKTKFYGAHQALLNFTRAL